MEASVVVGWDRGLDPRLGPTNQWAITWKGSPTVHVVEVSCGKERFHPICDQLLRLCELSELRRAIGQDLVSARGLNFQLVALQQTHLHISKFEVVQTLFRRATGGTRCLPSII